MLFDLTFPCYLTTFSGKKCLSGKIICAFFCPAYRSSPALQFTVLLNVTAFYGDGRAATPITSGPDIGQVLKATASPGSG
jgi:hypothetical protein